MFISRRIKFTLTLFALTALLSCTSDSDSSEDGSSDTEGDTTAGSLTIDVSGLPETTGSVAVADSSTDTDAASTQSDFDDLEVALVTSDASTGVTLGGDADTIKALMTAAGTPSRIQCETVDRALKFLQDAGSADTFACLMKESLTDKEDIYNGQPHYFSASVSDQSFDIKIVMSGTKTNVSGMKAYICSEGSQTHFFDISVTADKASAISVRTTPGGDVTGCSGDTTGLVRTVLDGFVNDSGQLIGRKNIDLKSYTSCDDGTVGRIQHANIQQSKTNFLYNGSQNEPINSNTRQFVLFAQLIDPNEAGGETDLTSLAIGNGAGKIKEGSAEYTQGFDGDSREKGTFASHERRIRVNATDYTDVPENNDGITFGDGETWDCTGDSEGELSFNNSSCLERFDLTQDPLDCDTIDY